MPGNASGGSWLRMIQTNHPRFWEDRITAHNANSRFQKRAVSEHVARLVFHVKHLKLQKCWGICIPGHLAIPGTAGDAPPIPVGLSPNPDINQTNANLAESGHRTYVRNVAKYLKLHLRDYLAPIPAPPFFIAMRCLVSTTRLPRIISTCNSFCSLFCTSRILLSAENAMPWVHTPVSTCEL